MSVEGHPSDVTLKSHAFGALAPGMELLVAAHLTYCPRCRAEVAAHEALGGAYLAEEAGDVSAPSLDDTLALLDAPPAAAGKRALGRSVYPAVLAPYLPTDPETIEWKRRLPGIWETELPGFGVEQVSLLKAVPGTRIMSHTHDGDEATLILQGQMADGDTVLGRGDVAEADASHDHQPQIIGTEDCICLIVLSGRMRFTGTFSRALNLFMR